jgi:hypothetical protein
MMHARLAPMPARPRTPSAERRPLSTSDRSRGPPRSRPRVAQAPSAPGCVQRSLNAVTVYTLPATRPTPRAAVRNSRTHHLDGPRWHPAATTTQEVSGPF